MEPFCSPPGTHPSSRWLEHTEGETIMAITVYSKPHCPKCDKTYRALDARGIDYEVVNVLTDAKALEYVTKTIGYLEAPVVVTDENHWSGYDEGKIDELASRVAA